MLKSAWAAVTTVTINNCYRHAGFQEGKSVTLADPEEDADDNIPLAQLVRIMGSHVSMDEYLDIDKEPQATEEVTNKTIFNGPIEARKADAIQSSNKEQPCRKTNTRTSVDYTSYRIFAYRLLIVSFELKDATYTIDCKLST